MKVAWLVIIALYLLLYIAPLNVRPLTIPDETRYAEIPREMLATGDWIVPRLIGVRYFEKPVMGYWLTAIAIKAFGENSFAVRFPSAIAAGISALAVLLLARRFAGGSAMAALTAAVFLSCVMVFAIGTFNVLDGVFSMFVTVSFALFFRAYMEDNAPRKKMFLALFGVFCGLGFLTKGFLAFALPAVVIAPFLFWERRWKDLLILPWIPMVAALLVVLPWAVMIHLREPDFWRYFVFIEHFQRFISAGGKQQQHPEAFWFFLPILVGGALPWTFLFSAVAGGVRSSDLKEPFIRFCICWLVFPFLFFSMSKGKLGTYILPCFPPIAILTAIGAFRYLESGRKKAFTGGLILSAALMSIVGIVLILSQTTSLPGFRFYSAEETWKWVAGVIAFFAWAGMSFIAMLVSGPHRKLAMCCLSPALVMLCASLIMPDQVNMDRVVQGKLVMRNQGWFQPDSIVILDSDDSPAVCWFLKRSDVYIMGGGGELSYGLKAETSKHRLLSMKDVGKVINKHRGEGRVVIIDELEEYVRWNQSLPKPIFEDTAGGFVLAVF